MKCHPFATHGDGDGGSGDVFESIPEFHGQEEVHPMDAYCGRGLECKKATCLRTADVEVSGSGDVNATSAVAF